MSSTTYFENELFAGGPPLKLQGLLGFVKPGEPNVARRAVLVVLIGWLPLVVLAVLESTVLQSNGSGSIGADFAVHARSLIAAPLFILAEAICIPRLGAIARHFLDAGLVRETDRVRFDEASASILRLRDSTLAEVVVISLAYAFIGALAYSFAIDGVPAWHRSGASFSLAGWWHVAVSLPLLVVLFLGWMWRLFLWTRFLWLVSRLDLRLVPSHPDKAAGLKVVGYSVRAWSILGFALGAIVAGTLANEIAQAGASLPAYEYVIGGIAAFSLVLFNAPLLAFSGRLLREWRRGVFEYGELADEYGWRFERKWLRRREALDERALEIQEFSAVTDLYQIVERVHDMRMFPVDLTSVIFLAFATLLPFVPVALMAVPLDTIVSGLANLLF
jgi:hypothetical protein